MTCSSEAASSARLYDERPACNFFKRCKSFAEERSRELRSSALGPYGNRVEGMQTSASLTVDATSSDCGLVTCNPVCGVCFGCPFAGLP